MLGALRKKVTIPLIFVRMRPPFEINFLFVYTYGCTVIIIQPPYSGNIRTKWRVFRAYNMFCLGFFFFLILLLPRCLYRLTNLYNANIRQYIHISITTVYQKWMYLHNYTARSTGNICLMYHVSGCNIVS